MAMGSVRSVGGLGVARAAKSSACVSHLDAFRTDNEPYHDASNSEHRILRCHYTDRVNSPIAGEGLHGPKT